MTGLDDFFAGGVTAEKFEDRQYGTVIGGVITDDPRMTQQRDYTTGEPITYPDGNPAMQMVVVVQAYEVNGEDDGKRAFYIKGQMKQAVGEALRTAGVRTPARGGKLWIKYTEDKPTTLKNGRPGNPQKIYIAKYEAPSQAAGAAYFETTNTAPASAPPAAPAASQVPADPAPAGVDAATWAQMNGDQRAQLRQALGMVEATPVGGPAFAGAPPF